METTKFQTLTIEGKLDALFTAIMDIAAKVNESAKPKSLISKPYYKISEIAKFANRSYVTVERAAKTAGINAHIISGNKAFTEEEVKLLLNVINKCS